MQLTRVLCTLLLVSALAAQQPAAETPKKDLARLDGRTVHSVTGEPVRKVNLTLRKMAANPGQPAATSSDAEGRFSFEGVEPGSYRLMGERAGFMTQEYGSRSGTFGGTAVTLTAGQHLKDLTFKLMPQGVIIGKVIDEDGEPLQRAQISVRSQSGNSGGGSMPTNDVGEFRVANLAPGKYLLSAIYRRGMFGSGGDVQRPRTDQPDDDYIPTYYPGVTDASSAAPIEVGPGQEVSGITIQMRKGKTYRIRGKVTGVAIDPNNRVQVTLGTREMRVSSMGGYGGSSGALKPDGTFELTSVQPGSYYVAAMRFAGRQPEMLGRVPVDVNSSHIDDVVIAAAEPVTITGSVRVEGQEKPKIGRAFLSLLPTEGMPMFQPNTQLKEDLTFTMEGVARDRYRLTVNGLPEEMYVKAVRTSGQDAPDGKTLDLTSAATGTAVEVILSPKAATVEGVAKKDGQPAPGTPILLLPDPYRPVDRSQVKMANADQTGRFRIAGVAPGKYRLYALEEFDRMAMMDPDYFKPVESKSVKVEPSEGAREQVDATVIPLADLKR